MIGNHVNPQGFPGFESLSLRCRAAETSGIVRGHAPSGRLRRRCPSAQATATPSPGILPMVRSELLLGKPFSHQSVAIESLDTIHTAHGTHTANTRPITTRPTHTNPRTKHPPKHTPPRKKRAPNACHPSMP